MNKPTDMKSIASLDDIKATLKGIISNDLDANISFESINEGISLYEDGLGLDSISIVKFVVAIEKKFQVSFGETEITAENFSTLNSLAFFLANKLKVPTKLTS
jgi:acyl carrier protein